MKICLIFLLSTNNKIIPVLFVIFFLLKICKNLELLKFSFFFHFKFNPDLVNKLNAINNNSLHLQVCSLNLS